MARHKAHKQVSLNNRKRANDRKEMIAERIDRVNRRARKLETFTLRELAEWYDSAKLAGIALGELPADCRALKGFILDDNEAETVLPCDDIRVNLKDFMLGFVRPVFA